MQNYNFIQKLLHDFVLSKKLINKSLYEIEKLFFLKKKNIEKQQHIFISGLPRSGTTSILNFFNSSNEYASLTYGNMPFILSPNFSKLFDKKVLKKERLHGDGIIYDSDSPEAFDEIFFNNESEFIKNELITYINLILFSKNKLQYLSKNNHNYKRIDLISSLLPNSIFLIPIREPMQHSYSLLNQHLRFKKLQKKNDFIRRYMNYLNHTEFGLNHKPWNKPINHIELNKIDYWLEQWVLFYKKIYNKYNSYKKCYFIIYEELSNPNYVEKLLKKINLNKCENLNFKYFKNYNKQEINTKYSKNIYKSSEILYDKFTNNSL